MNKTYYKIVDKIGNNYYYLFHGIDKSRKINTNKWITADKKIVSDGNNGPKYESGFHILLTQDDADLYLKRFKDIKKQRYIIEVFAKGIRKKEHSRSNVYLADKIKLKK